jgi:hypothetical protein
VLNLAPVLADLWVVTPSSACKFVLVSLANNAGPDSDATVTACSSCASSPEHPSSTAPPPSSSMANTADSLSASLNPAVTSRLLCPTGTVAVSPTVKLDAVNTTPAPTSVRVCGSRP